VGGIKKAKRQKECATSTFAGVNHSRAKGATLESKGGGEWSGKQTGGKGKPPPARTKDKFFEKWQKKRKTFVHLGEGNTKMKGGGRRRGCLVKAHCPKLKH